MLNSTTIMSTFSLCYSFSITDKSEWIICNLIMTIGLIALIIMKESRFMEYYNAIISKHCTHSTAARAAHFTEMKQNTPHTTIEIQFSTNWNSKDQRIAPLPFRLHLHTPDFCKNFNSGCILMTVSDHHLCKKVLKI